MFRLLRKFRKNEEGASAIEFAFLMPIILLLSFYILETSWYFTRIVVFDRAVRIVTNDIYVGAVGSAGLTAADLEKEICDEFFLSGTSSSCRSSLVLELTEVTDFTSLPTDDAECISFNSSNQVVRPLVDFNVGTGSSVIFLRACFSTEFLLPGIGFALNVGNSDGRHNMISSAAFINEPT
ncbi:MAG: TadE/TadG family type IV pilus assembly protein [Hyphomicrobiales bacterium]